MCIHVYVQYFRVFFSWPLWCLQLFHNVLTPPGEIMKLFWFWVFFINKYSHWNLSKSQNVPEVIPNSTEESHKVASLNFTTFVDKWLFKRWIHTTQRFYTHFPTTIIKRNYISLNCQLSDFGMQNYSGCFSGETWYILLKYSQKFFILLVLIFIALDL